MPYRARRRITSRRAAWLSSHGSGVFIAPAVHRSGRAGAAPGTCVLRLHGAIVRVHGSRRSTEVPARSVRGPFGAIAQWKSRLRSATGPRRTRGAHSVLAMMWTTSSCRWICAGNSEKHRGFGQGDANCSNTLPDDEVHKPRFILKRHKCHARRGPGRLPADHEPRVPDAPAVRKRTHGARQAARRPGVLLGGIPADARGDCDRWRGSPRRSLRRVSGDRARDWALGWPARAGYPAGARARGPARAPSADRTRTRRARPPPRARRTPPVEPGPLHAVVERGERRGRACMDEALAVLLAEAVDVPQSHAHGELPGEVRARLKRALPRAVSDLHGPDRDAVALGVFDDRRGAVKAHGLSVEERARELRGEVALEIRGRVGDEGKAGRV